MNPIAIETRIASANLGLVDSYQPPHNRSSTLVVQNHHQEMLDRATLGGTTFNPIAINSILGGACALNPSAGVVPLEDNGNLSYSGVEDQYRRARFAFQFNVEYRTNGLHGAATLFGYTNVADIVNGNIPNHMEFTVNSVTLYTMSHDGRTKPKLVQTYTGRIHGKDPLAPIGKMRDNQFGGTSLSLGFGGGASGSSWGKISNNDFGLLTSPVIGATLGVEKASDNHVDVRLSPGLNASSFDANNTPKLVTNLLEGFSEGKKQAFSIYNESAGKWVDDEEQLFNGGNAIAMSWAIAANNNSSEDLLTQNRLIGYIRKAVPSFELNCKLTWGQIKKLFNGIDNATRVGTQSFHKEMEHVFGITNESMSLGGSHIENQLSDRLVQLIPSTIAPLGFTRFSCMGTNRTSSSFGNNKDNLNPLGNIDHPFMNNSPDAMRDHISRALDNIKNYICPSLSDNGNRHYMFEFHYTFGGDARIIIDVGNGPKRTVYPKFPDSSAAAVASFNHKADLNNLTSSIDSLADGLGHFSHNPTTPSAKLGGWGDLPNERKADTSNWGTFGGANSLKNVKF